MGVRQKLLALIREVFPEADLVAVGSTVNGCGSYNSDMDLCLCLPITANGFASERTIDDRFPALCLLVKHWAITANINNALLGTLNRFVTICILFMQKKKLHYSTGSAKE
ncbi:unnamed protein product [Gongylonema pulchrum]|uniref:NTP_transf_2 domain-containing protein n=1 Tax=Gongylonema pulchrum TaxID=637853 RepID=A0A183E186_9BILA|nr:unnamed protein product [Gongylonema pulchrum]